MRILGIETSCDETALAVVEANGGVERPRFRIVLNLMMSQVALHAPYGGVVPNLAKRAHREALAELKKQVEKSGVKLGEINALAVTVGPGLEPCLWEGITFTQELVREFKKPVVAVNHMEGHLASVLLGPPAGGEREIRFPALALLVSGGHTELVWMKQWLDYEILGETQDDAVGEAFDKVARLLGLPYPGGPEISKLAEKARAKNVRHSVSNINAIELPRPMIKSRDLNFSFSGLKTAVLYALRSAGRQTPAGGPSLDTAEVARAFEDAAVDALVFKTVKAMKAKDPRTVILAGGVSANRHLRRELERAVAAESAGVPVLYPDPAFTGDNAAMIAAAGYLHAQKHDFTSAEELKAEGRLRLTV